MKHAVKLMIISLLAMSLLISCGENKSDNPDSKKDAAKADTVKTDTAKTDAVQTSEQNMTVEKACKLDSEQAALLMEKYWSKFKDKDYQEVKDIYKQYLKEDDAIYNKYGVSTDKNGFDVQDYEYWARDNKSEMKKFREENPEYDFYAKYPDFSAANVQLYKFSMAEFAESK